MLGTISWDPAVNPGMEKIVLRIQSFRIVCTMTVGF